MDISNYVSKSIKTLRRQPVLILPSIILIFGYALAMILFLVVSGLFTPLTGYVSYVGANDLDQGTLLFPAVLDSSTDNQLTLEDEILLQALTQNTLVAAMITVIFMALIGVSFSCLHYVVISSAIRKKPLRIASIFF